MAELRLNDASSFGTLNLITVAANSTSVTWARVPAFPTIASPSYAKITLEPDSTNEEIVYLTAYTAGTTTGTLIRNAEPTNGGANAAIAHIGAAWVHGPTAGNLAAPAIIGPAATGVVGTDRPNLIAAIAATPVGGRLVLPSSPSGTFYAIDQPLQLANHITIEGDAVSSYLGQGPSGVLPAAPYLAGSVIQQVTAGTDILQITGVGKSVNLRKLGLLFASGLASTGHGIVSIPPSGVFGMYASSWESVFVSGHDGNHYAFKLINFLLSTFKHCHSYFGGGWYLGSLGTFAGNSVFQNCYVGMGNSGSADVFDLSCDSGINLNECVFINPTCFVSGAAATAGTQYLWNDYLGASIPDLFTVIGASLQSVGSNPTRVSPGTQMVAQAQSNGLPVSNTIQGVLSSGWAAVNNTAYGYRALNAVAAGGTQNTAIGADALSSLTTGNLCTAVGYNALTSLTTGIAATAVGHTALAAVTTGGYGTAVGYKALAVLTVGTNDVAMGDSGLAAVTSGSRNTGIGSQALAAATTSSDNTAVGMQAGNAVTTGGQNVLVGSLTGTAIVTGGQNCLVGQKAGTNSTDSSFATAVGANAEAVTFATALGYGASATANGAVAIGMDSGGASASSAVANVFALGTANHLVKLSNNATGSGSAALGANCPATTVTAPYTWVRIQTGDGSTAYVPAWK